MSMVLVDLLKNVFIAQINSDQTVNLRLVSYGYSIFSYFYSFAQVFLASQNNQLHAYFIDTQNEEDIYLGETQSSIINFTAFEGDQRVLLSYLSVNNVQFVEYQLNNQFQWRQCSSPNCAICQQDNESLCQVCTKDLNRQIQSNLCECIPSYFEDPTLAQCQKCSNSCLTCVDTATTCTFCSKNQFRQLSGSRCICQDGYYENNLKLCVVCDPSKNLVIRDYQCVCQDGYYMDTNGLCLQCHLSCKTCQNQANQCTSCKDGINREYNSILKACNCITQYFSFPDQEICQICDPLENKILIQGKCLCQDGYYMEEQLQVCVQCSKGCTLCENQDVCYSCDQSQNLEKWNTKCICKIGYLLINGECLQCPKFCQECKDNQCISCYSNKNRYILNNECVCNQGFTENTEGECIFCDQTKNKVIQQGKCICKDGFYADDNDNCELCVANCQSCIKNQYQCTDFSLSSLHQNQLRINFKESFAEKISIQDCTLITIERLSKDTWSILQPLSEFSLEFVDINNYQIEILINPNTGIQQICNVKIDLSKCFIPNLSQSIATLDVQLKAELKGDDEKVSESISQVVEMGSQIVVTSMLPLFISGNFQFLASLLDICQLIYAMIFINIDTPLNLKLFYDAIQEFNIPFTNFFEKIDHFEDINDTSPQKFTEEDKQGFFLANFGDNLSLSIVVVLIDILAFGLSVMLPNQKTKKILKTARSKVFNAKLYLDLLWGLYIELCMAVFLQLQSIEKAEYFLEVVSYMITFVSIAFIGLPYYICYLIKKGKKNYFTDILTEDLNFKYYNILLYFRKFVLIFAVTVLYNDPLLQIIFFMVWNLFQLFITIKLKPYESKLNNIKHTVQSLFFFSSTILLTILFKNQEESTEEDRIDLCWAIIANLIIIILADFLSFIYQLVTALLSYSKKLTAQIKDFKNKNRKVIPNDILIDMEKVKQFSQSSQTQQEQIKSESLPDKQKKQKLNSQKILSFQEISIINEQRNAQLLQKNEQDDQDLESNRIDLAALAQSKIYSNQELIVVGQNISNKSVCQNDIESAHQNSKKFEQVSSWNDLSSPQFLQQQGNQFDNFEIRGADITNNKTAQRKKQIKFKNRKQSQLTAASDKQEKATSGNNILDSNLKDSHQENKKKPVQQQIKPSFNKKIILPKIIKK